MEQQVGKMDAIYIRHNNWILGIYICNRELLLWIPICILFLRRTQMLCVCIDYYWVDILSFHAARKDDFLEEEAELNVEWDLHWNLKWWTVVRSNSFLTFRLNCTDIQIQHSNILHWRNAKVKLTNSTNHYFTSHISSSKKVNPS